jgi:hypothetical protein
MIKKNLATLAFFSAAMTGMVQAAENLSNEDVAREVAACGATALSARVQQLPLGADVGYDYAFNALRRVASRVIGHEATQEAMLEKSRVYDLAAQTLTPEEVAGLIEYDVWKCQKWFDYAAWNAAQEPVRRKEEQTGIPSCGPQILIF